MGRNEAWNILEEAPRRADRLGDADDLPEEAAALTLQALPFARHAQVLTWKPPAEQVNLRDLSLSARDFS